MNSPVKFFLMLALMLAPVAGLRANSARLIAYAVKAEQIEAARDMTADDCRLKLPTLWTENVEILPSAAAKVSHSSNGRSVNLRIDAKPVAGSANLRVSLLWGETVKPATGPERQRSLNTNVVVQPGTAIVVARNLSQVIANGEKIEQLSGGVIYVLAVWTDEMK